MRLQMVSPACKAPLHTTGCPEPWGRCVARAESRAGARSIFVDLLLLCGVPVLVAAKALVGVRSSPAWRSLCLARCTTA